MIAFKREYHSRIKKGEITETIRFWDAWKASQIRKGKLAFIYGLGYIMVEDMEKVRLSQLTEEDAQRCGDSSLSAMKASLIRTYSKLHPEKNLEEEDWFRIRFRYMYKDIPIGIDNDA